MTAEPKGLTDAEKLAREFHDRYERYAPSFGYETRKETRVFDPTTANGRLMVAVCANLIHSGLAGAASVQGGPVAWLYVSETSRHISETRTHRLGAGWTEIPLYAMCDAAREGK